jgi:addiction module HigA family antidote
MRMTWKLWTATKAKQSGARAKRLKPVHPGEILREEFLTPLGLSANKLALDLRVPVTRISEIVNERRSISPETALRLAHYFNTTPEFWMNLQTQYDLETTEDEMLEAIRRDVRPFKLATLPDSPLLRRKK